MRPTPKWNEELPLKPARPIRPPRRYSLAVDGRRPVSVVVTEARPPAEPELRGPVPRQATISGAEIAGQVRLAQLRAHILTLPPATRAAYLARLRARARAKGLR